MLPLILTLAAGVFAGALDLGVLSPALPEIGRTFAVPTAQLAWIFTIYLLANVASIVVAGALADRYGRRIVYLGCLTVFAAGSLLAISAPSFAVFLLARAIQAAGAGGIFPVAAAAIGDLVAPERRGSALGLVAATWGLAAVIGPLAGGLVTQTLGWRWIFAANIPLALFVAFRARRDLPARAPRQQGRLDLIGLSLLTGGLVALAIGVAELRAAAAGIGIAVLAAFASWELRAEHPVLPPSLMRNPRLALTYVLEVLIGILEGSLFFVPTVLVRGEGLSASAAGAVAAIGAVLFVATIPASGRALDRSGSRAVLSFGTLATAAGLGLFAVGFTHLGAAIAAMIIAGIGFGALLGAPTRYIVTNEAPAESRALAVGLLSQFLIMGQLVGSAFASGMLHAAGDRTPGLRMLYLAFTAVAVIATVPVAWLPSRSQERARLGEAQGNH